MIDTGSKYYKKSKYPQNTFYYNSFKLEQVFVNHNAINITRTVRGSDYSPAIALSEDIEIFRNCDATLQNMVLYNLSVDLVNENVYT